MYCSIQEAFVDTNATPVSRKPRRPKREQRDRIERFQTDPDRPANVPMPAPDFVGGGIQQPSYSNLLAAIDGDQSYFPHPSEDVPAGESAYMLEPDWTKQFNGPSVPPWIKERVAAKEAEIPLRFGNTSAGPSPAPATTANPSWMDGQPTLWQRVPAAYVADTPMPGFTLGQGQQPIATAAPTAAAAYPDLDERFSQFESKMESKLDKMFARLSELDRAKSESNHIEIILFIIGGLFVLLMLDILVKQGTRASLMLAAAGGGVDLYKRYMSR